VGQTLAEAIDNPTSSEVYVANPPGGSPDTSNSLLILNPATGLPVKSITVGYSAMDSYNNFGARRFAVDRTRNVTYVSNGADNTISVVAGGTDTVTTPIQGLSGPIAVDETSGRIYVLNVSAGQVFAVDGASYQRVSSYSLTKSAVDTSEAPADVAVDASVQKLYVVTLDGFTPAGNTLTTIDLPTGTARTVEIPGIPADPYSYPNAVVANPDDHRVYVSNGYDLSISIYDGTKL
jgi:DNA-binding beta-propeller fold protein YncE